MVLHQGKVLLIQARDLKGRAVWTFPKGKLNPSEKSPQAALREVEEETGWRTRIMGELRKSEYWFQREGHRVKKMVRWFLMSVVEEAGKPDAEVDQVAWVPAAEAVDRLTYESDRELLQEAVSVAQR